MFSNESRQFDDTVVSLEYLMSRFAASRTPWMARAIIQHLEKLIAHRDLGKRDFYARLLPTWKAVVQELETGRPDEMASERVDLLGLGGFDWRESRAAVS